MSDYIPSDQVTDAPVSVQAWIEIGEPGVWCYWTEDGTRCVIITEERPNAPTIDPLK